MIRAELAPVLGAGRPARTLRVGAPAGEGRRGSVETVSARTRKRAIEGSASAMGDFTTQQLHEWCRVPHDELERHPGLRIPFRLCADAEAMGELMARELVDVIAANEQAGRETRAIIPCGPSGWYRPFADLVNSRRLSLRRLVVFHMDECLDWAGAELPRAHPYSFRGFMERHFYEPVEADLRVPEAQRHWLAPSTIEAVGAAIAAAPVDVAYGGWGQDGHVAYNQARRHPYARIGLDELRTSTIRVQENNVDTILALAHRTFGGGVPVRAPDVRHARHAGDPGRSPGPLVQ